MTDKKSEKPKQGETKEITQKTDEEKEKDFKGSGIEGTKDAENLKAENARLKEENADLKSEINKDYVTGEDALKNLRENGHKI